MAGDAVLVVDEAVGVAQGDRLGAELEQFLSLEYPDLDVAAAVAESAEQVDRFQVYQALLLPLENVKQNLKYHPEGDALYHSLQVFDLARDELPYSPAFDGLVQGFQDRTFKNADPTVPHFVVLSQVAEGTTTDQVLTSLNSQEPPPEFDLPAGVPSDIQEHVRLMYDLMALAYQGVMGRCMGEQSCSLRDAAQWIGVERVLEAVRLRGIFP